MNTIGTQSWCSRTQRNYNEHHWNTTEL
jgi:hypothetical protein